LFETRVEKNFQIETFDLKSDRDARKHELATRRNDDGSIAWPIRLSARRRKRDHQLPSGPCPKKQRRSRYWRRHPALHAKQRDMIRKSFVVPQRAADGRDVAKNA